MVGRSLAIGIVLSSVVSLAGCARGIDRVETATPTLTASSSGPSADSPSSPNAVTAKATLVRACQTADPDPRTTSDHARTCAKGDPDGCLHLGIAHLCGANGSENGLAAIPLFEKSCQLEDDRGCLLLQAARVVWSRPTAVVSLLDDAAL